LPFRYGVLDLSFETLLVAIFHLLCETNRESPGYYSVTDCLPNSHQGAKGTSRAVSRNKGIKNKHLRSGFKGQGFVGNLGMNKSGEQESLGVVPVVQNQEQVIGKAAKGLC